MKIESLSSHASGSPVVTEIKPAVKNQNRVNIYLDHKYSFSLDISQLADHPLKIGQSLTDEDISRYRNLSNFGLLYTRALEYALVRPRSEKELTDYLARKTIPTKIRVKDQRTNEWVTKDKKVYDKSLIPPIISRLKDRGYVSDETFAKYYIENRFIKKGISKKRLRLELRQKGIASDIIARALLETPRNESAEIAKIIEKKRNKYTDEVKLKQYLMRQGFSLDAINSALNPDPF